MGLYFGLIIVALGFAAVSGAAMAWDGSHFLFKTLDLQAPVPPHGCLVNIPLHWLVLVGCPLSFDFASLTVTS
jgi:hypothetical protein